MTSSFQNKRKVKATGIKGTKVSLPNRLLLASSGISSLDRLLGGGIAVGTVILIEEDIGHVYSDFLLKCFLAEGVLSDHEIFFSSLDISAEEILNDLPGVSNTLGISQNIPNPNSDDLKIAWRYKDMTLQVEESSQFGHSFDMSKKMDKEMIQNSKKVLIDRNSIKILKTSPDADPSTPFQEMLKKCSIHISESKFSTKSDKKHETILRIGIHSIGSPQWDFNSEIPKFALQMNRFFVALKNMTRRSYSVALVTIPSHLYEDFSVMDSIAKECDAIFRLESFAATDLEQKDTWKDYSGLFHVVKLPKLNSMLSPDVDTSDLAFKIKRRKFVIEKVHLPPMFTPENDKELKYNAIENSKTLYQSNSCSKFAVDF